MVLRSTGRCDMCIRAFATYATMRRSASTRRSPSAHLWMGAVLLVFITTTTCRAQDAESEEYSHTQWVDSNGKVCARHRHLVRPSIRRYWVLQLSELCGVDHQVTNALLEERKVADQSYYNRISICERFGTVQPGFEKRLVVVGKANVTQDYSKVCLSKERRRS